MNSFLLGSHHPWFALGWLALLGVLVAPAPSARAQELPFCGVAAPGELCISDGISGFSSCFDAFGNVNPTLGEGAPCRDDGRACFVESGGITCDEIVASRCSGPDQIVQACLAASGPGDPLPPLRELTGQAVDGVLRDHVLPPSDADLVYTYARNSVRAYLWAELQRLIQANPPDAEQQGIIDFYTARLKELRIRQAGISQAEYATFAADPCGYTPPAPFQFDPPFACGLPLADLFSSSAAHPGIEEFEAYGISEVTRQDILDDPEALKIAGGTGAALLFGAGLAASLAVALGVFAVLYLSGTGSVLVTSLVGLTAPYALIPFSGTLITGVVSGIVGIAGAVGIVVFAIVGSVLIVIDFVEYEEFVAEVNSLSGRALIIPDLRHEIASQRGRNDLYQVYLKSTQPEFYPVGTVPAASPDDPQFEVMDENGNPLAIQPSIELGLGEASRDAGLISLSTGLYGGWFVPTTIHIDDEQQQQVDTTLSLGAEFVDWDGVLRVAWRRGTEFVVRTDGQSSEDVSISSELRYLDPDGNRRSASIFFADDTAPTVTPLLSGQTVNDSGWFVSQVVLEWIIEDPESEITSTQGCEFVVVSDDGAFENSCTATSDGGTTSVPVTVLKDTLPPGLSSSTSPLPNADGWNHTDVVVGYICEDPVPGSGIDTCPGEVTLTGEGMLVVSLGTARDVAGNVGVGTSIGVAIDRAAPTASIQVPEVGATYVSDQNVTVIWSAADTLSGLAQSNASFADGTPLDTSTPGEFMFTVTARDAAENIAELTRSYSVLSAGQTTRQLVDSLGELGTGRNARTALTAKLAGAAKAFEADRTRVDVNKLRAFINEVQALDGKKLSPEAAAALLSQASTIIDAVT